MWHFQVEYGSWGEKLLHWFKLCIYNLIRSRFQLESVTYDHLTMTSHYACKGLWNVQNDLLWQWHFILVKLISIKMTKHVQVNILSLLMQTDMTRVWVKKSQISKSDTSVDRLERERCQVIGRHNEHVEGKQPILETTRSHHRHF